MEFISDIESPRLLGFLLLANIPIFIRFAQTVYSDPDELADDVKDALLTLASDGDVQSGNADAENWSPRRFYGTIFYILVCASFIKAEYVFFNWLSS